ncbi:MAG: hypothetical protein OXG98_16630 [Gemmatimonadetes bacterium]|nr:hypothetical protein [Gemmatimonadota bacterium]
MPNGGSDCCGTCRFNTANAGRRDYDPLPDGNVASYCEIGGLDIEDPFWTYCGNHTSRLKRGFDVPLGPVYVHEWVSDVNPKTGNQILRSNRRLWIDAPDTEEVRVQFLRFLKEPELLSDSYPLYGKDLLREAVDELERLREPRAIPILEDIAKDLRENGEEWDGIQTAIKRIQSALEGDRG